MLRRARSSFHFVKILSSLRSGDVENARRHFERFISFREQLVQHMALNARIMINERKSSDAELILNHALLRLELDVNYNETDREYISTFIRYYLGLINRDSDSETLRISGINLRPRDIIARTLPFPTEKIPVE